MKEFILTYWKQILDILSILFCVTFFVIKKRPVKVVDGVLNFIYKVVPQFINQYEVPGNGSAKKIKVINAVIASIKEVYPDVDTNLWIGFIDGIIEDYLSTPKKGE